MASQHIGQDFTTQVKLNLLPGFTLPRGVFQMEIQYITDTGGQITMHHISHNMMGGTKQDLEAIVGQDVRSINFRMHCHNSFPTNPLIYYRYDLRIDRLILLNLAVKLINIKAN